MSQRYFGRPQADDGWRPLAQLRRAEAGDAAARRYPLGDATIGQPEKVVGLGASGLE